MEAKLIEQQIRQAAFDWLRIQCQIYSEKLPWQILAKGFEFHGERITLVGPSGIWKPQQFKEQPLSITTVINGPYPDTKSDEGFLLYKYRGRDPNHRDNFGLRSVYRERTPLIYFVNLERGFYRAYFPVYVIGDNPQKLEFTVALQEQQYLVNDRSAESAGETNIDYIRRAYNMTVVEHRVFQPIFRIKVLQAYNSKCCLCRINHEELLDAAHIVPDNEPHGDPIVPNGLTLCKIHHAAYDANIIGISPDFRVEVREDVLEEIDGPMLKHGIQGLNGQNIILPQKRRDYPDRERLEWRFDRFRNTG